MKIAGLQKTTLLDYPGYLAATIFTAGCNICCPYCHNSELIQINQIPENLILSENEVLAFLEKRTGLLDGVCITGGEPTLQPDLEAFILKVKHLGYLVKLDTNGSRPDILKRLCEKNYVDYVAMDIKSSPENYGIACGIPDLNISPFKESVSYLKNQHTVPYEFRTTVVNGIHTKEDFASIKNWITPCPSYYLQSFKDSEQVIYSGFSSFSNEDLKEFASIVQGKEPTPFTFIRAGST